MSAQRLLAVASHWVPVMIAAAVPLAPNCRIVRQGLSRDITKRLEDPFAGLGIKRRIFCKI